MFSLDKFYDIVHNNLIDPLPINCASAYFFPFGTYQDRVVLNKCSLQYTEVPEYVSMPLLRRSFLHCYFFDQEPFYEITKTIFDYNNLKSFPGYSSGSPRDFVIIANSEKSDLLLQHLRNNQYYNWYYFFHGFAALDWYRNFQYFDSKLFNRFDKVFICYNHLTSKLRSYRLHLVSNMIEQNLLQYGHVSLFHQDWKQTVVDPEVPLDSRARVKIYKCLTHLQQPLIIDTAEPNGALSAEVNFDSLTSALWHVVTETVYFDPKLHLTEKIFKPIVAKRPFILVGAPGNLRYLKSYGFQTFDRWIDESYDQETDHYLRIEKITAELVRLCALDRASLEQMHQEMQEILEYNFDHFYSNFKNIIIDEMVDNFEHVLMQINNGRQPGNHSRHHQRIDMPKSHFEKIKKRLAQ